MALWVFSIVEHGLQILIVKNMFTVNNFINLPFQHESMQSRLMTKKKAVVFICFISKCSVPAHFVLIKLGLTQLLGAVF